MRTPLALPCLSLLLFAAPGAHAVSCEALRAQIEAKIQAAGVKQFSLTVVDAQSGAPGRVVGSCELGHRKIVYLQGAAGAAPAPAAPAASAPPARPRAQADNVITECADGSVKVGGDCRRK